MLLQCSDIIDKIKVLIKITTRPSSFLVFIFLLTTNRRSAFKPLALGPSSKWAPANEKAVPCRWMIERSGDEPRHTTG